LAPQLLRQSPRGEKKGKIDCATNLNLDNKQHNGPVTFHLMQRGSANHRAGRVLFFENNALALYRSNFTL
jgi:hypothetical protein